MVVSYHTGDMLTSSARALGHGVNTHGLMGAGIAKVIRARFPEVYSPYSTACSRGVLIPGSMLPVQVKDGRWILNLASQDKPGKHARLEWLEESLDAALVFCYEQELPSFALPRIGAGIGGLNWEEAREVIERISAKYPQVSVEVWSL